MPETDAGDADEIAAGAARARYRAEGMGALTVDELIAPHLAPGERLVAARDPAVVRRRSSSDAADDPPAVAGTLYLTSRRLIVLGAETLEADLEDIEEAVLSGDCLLLALRHGIGLSVEVDRPQLLRVEIAAARAVAREPEPRRAEPRRPAPDPRV